MTKSRRERDKTNTYASVGAIDFGFLSDAVATLSFWLKTANRSSADRTCGLCDVLYRSRATLTVCWTFCCVCWLSYVSCAFYVDWSPTTMSMMTTNRASCFSLSSHDLAPNQLRRMAEERESAAIRYQPVSTNLTSQHASAECSTFALSDRWTATSSYRADADRPTLKHKVAMDSRFKNILAQQVALRNSIKSTIELTERRRNRINLVKLFLTIILTAFGLRRLITRIWVRFFLLTQPILFGFGELRQSFSNLFCSMLKCNRLDSDPFLEWNESFVKLDRSFIIPSKFTFSTCSGSQSLCSSAVRSFSSPSDSSSELLL